MATATWNGRIIAQTDQFKTVEGNIYFPPSAIKPGYLRESSHTTVCPWKGIASYFDIEVDGKLNANAAWYYPEPKLAATDIKDYVAFWKGVEVET